MALRTYTVYLISGGSFTLKAARFEVSDGEVTFFDESDQPLRDTYVDPEAVIAVIPPAPSSGAGAFPSVQGLQQPAS